MISTRLTKMFDIRHPVVLAPLGGVGRAELVAAVCNAGGLKIVAQAESALRRLPASLA
jgi:nitronate monooxygenase